MKSILIQDISELIQYLSSDLFSILHQFRYGHLLQVHSNKALEWIIAEEIELIYSLFSIKHEHNNGVYLPIYNALNQVTKIPLSTIIGHYVKAPKIYNDHNQISIEIKHRDLYIEYYFNRAPLDTYK